MKTCIQLIKKSSMRLFNNRHALFGFFTKNQAQISGFNEAIFRNNITAIKLDPNAPQFKRYSFIFKVDRQGKVNNSYEWIKEMDIQTLSAFLQLLANLTHRHQRHIIDANSYLKLLQSYYGYFGLHDQRKLLNRIINPSIKLQHILPSFIHTENAQVLEVLKMKQFYLFQLICRSKRVTLDQFMRIINPNIYNITDLPLINKYFYLYLYPQFSQIKTVRQLLTVLSYLSRFNAITILVVQKSAQIIKRQLETIPKFQDPVAQLSAYLQISNCIAILQLKTNKTVKRTPQTQLQVIQLELSTRPITMNGRTFTISQLQNQPILTNLIKDLSNIVIRNIKNYLEEIKNDKGDKQMVPQPIRNVILKQVQMLRLYDGNKVKKLVQLQLIPVIVKYILSQIHFNSNISLSNQAFLISQLFVSFCEKNPCYPDLHKELLLTNDMHPQLFTNLQRLSTSLNNFRAKANVFLNKTIKQGTNSQILKHYSPKSAFKQRLNQGWLWDLHGQALSNRILQMNQDYSIGNLLGMLKEDSNFLQSRMGLNGLQIIKYAIEFHQMKSQWKADVWDYPHHYTLVKKSPLKSEQQDKEIFYSKFTKELFFPPEVVPLRPRKLMQDFYNKIGR